MAAKRLRDGSDNDFNRPDRSSEQKRLRALPSFSTVIKEAMMLRSMHNLLGAIEPLFRRVMKEELERVLHSTLLFQRSPQVQIEDVESSNLQLIFQKPPSLPIFTNSKIEDAENNPLQILLIDTQNGQLVPLPSPVKLQVVVLDGDFASNGRDNWTSSNFDKSIVKERTGRRPLLTGDFSVILREGSASIGDLTFTDNSSWIRSQHFRIGVKVVQDGSYKGLRIREAITEAFRVKDHRGELYKKHYPPALTDEVWRLERIGKDGAFHTRLSSEGINTVHDFLKLWTVDPTRLRGILRVGMSDRMWEGTIGHAKTCPIGKRLYVHRKLNCTVVLNNICEIVAVHINGVTYQYQQLNRSQKVYVQEMVNEAYQNWDFLEQAGALQDQTMPQTAMEASPWYHDSDIHVEDIGEFETAIATIFRGHHG